MAVGSLHQRESAAGRVTPMEIAHHHLFTAREKLELLHRLRAEVTGERANPQALDFSLEDIDKAIDEVRAGTLGPDLTSSRGEHVPHHR